MKTIENRKAKRFRAMQVNETMNQEKEKDLAMVPEGQIKPNRVAKSEAPQRLERMLGSLKRLKSPFEEL